ncbi:MAG: DoxX family protein [Verrucomicrobiae bacterium]|nr:DoxX family protein [Verrucomicrobiae bacterium]
MALLNPTSPTPLDLSEHRVGVADFYRLFLRVLIAVPMFFYQAKAQTWLAWGFLWEQKEWPLLEAIKEMNLPQPSVTAVGLIFVLLFAPIGILTGFLTRVNACLTLMAVAFFFFTGLPLSDWLSGQTYVLYLGLCLVLVLSGPGAFSIDGIFSFLRRRRKMRKADDL